MRTSSNAPDVAIHAEGLGKRYLIAAPGRRQDTLRDALANTANTILRCGASRSRRESFWALSDVSFSIRQGENVGILGLNGAGKSTLLKVLSRVTDPTTGEARIKGRLGSLLEVGTGFHGELTGRENVFLYGAILGMTKAEITRKFDAIVAFAGVETFIDTPVKRYSSGMYVRLAFSVAAHLEPDVLLLDEVLSVGDLAFQRKCIDFAKDLQKRQATILFVSHNMFSIKTMCERVIYLRRGRVVFDGPTDKGIELYEADSMLGAVPWAGAAGLDGEGERPLTITGASITDENGLPKAVFDHGDRLRMRIRYRTTAPVQSPNVIVAFIRSDGVACCNFSTALDGVTLDPDVEDGELELLTPPLALVSELYRVEILIRENGFGKLVGAQGGGTFHVRDPVLDVHFGVFHERGGWTVQTRDAVRIAPVGAVA